MSIDYMRTLMSKAGLDNFSIAAEDAYAASRAHITRWGRWRLEGYSLVFRGPYQIKDATGTYTLTTTYDIELDRCLTATEIADWIFQINGKIWCTPKVMKDFVSAIEEILDPQENVCSWGMKPTPVRREGRHLAMTVEEMQSRVDIRLSAPKETSR